MMTDRLDTLRRYYAGEMLRLADIAADDRLKQAFATVRREDFLGPPPWKSNNLKQYNDMMADDPSVLYQDILVGLDPSRGINNGSPSLHARGIHALAPREGETVVHIGAGTGYYTAILAEMVSPGGKVVAIEFDPGLADQARKNLAERTCVEVINGNGLEYPREPADIVYVNFAVDRPADAWVERLKPAGRLLFPLGVPAAVRAMSGSDFTEIAGYLLVTRQPTGFAARFLLRVSFIWAEGIGRESPDTHERLRTAFRQGGARAVQSLRWKTEPLADEWYGTADWGLSSRALGG